MTQEVVRVVAPTGRDDIDAVAALECPKCQAPVGAGCRTPKGRIIKYVHIPRIKALKAFRAEAEKKSE